MPPKKKGTRAQKRQQKTSKTNASVRSKKAKNSDNDKEINTEKIIEEVVEVEVNDDNQEARQQEVPMTSTSFTVTIPPDAHMSTGAAAGTSVNGMLDNTHIRSETQNISVNSNSLWGSALPTESIVNSLSGLHSIGASNSTVPDLTLSPDDDIEAHVPMPLRQKIWKNEYLNLSLMLKGSIELSEYCFGGPIYTDRITGQLITKPQKVNDKISNIDQYTDAFLIYMSIYLQKYPTHAPQMLKYLKTLRSAARTGNGWLTYDEQFRLRRAVNPSMSWGEINTTLWLTTVGTQNDVGGRTSGKLNNVNKISLPCFAFNDGACQWRNCKYLHVCSICSESNHTKYTCNRQQVNQNNQRSANSATSNAQLAPSSFRPQRFPGPRQPEQRFIPRAYPHQR